MNRCKLRWIIPRKTYWPAGYEQYEISNYARPGFQCRHNLLYWTQGEYLGVGPSAQSLVGDVRFGNVANLTRYKASLTESRLPVQERSLFDPPRTAP